MLTKLLIKNIALIDEAEINFTSGINVLSGETGAGKSVVIDSLNFVLGAKADKTMLRYGKEECSVCAVFSLEENSELKAVLADLDVEYDNEIIIQRKLTSDGRSGIKVNGEMFTSQMLRQITAHLVDVHGQSEHYALLKPSEQLKLVDKFDCNKIEPIKTEIGPLAKRYNEINAELMGMFGRESERAIRKDVLSYQLKEIDDADLKDGEDEELQELSKKYRNSEKIVEAINTSLSLLDDDGGAIDKVGNALSNISSINRFSADYECFTARLDSASIELKDIVDGLRNKLDEFDFSPEDAERVEERLELIKKLKKKYGQSIEEIRKFYADASSELDKLKNIEKYGEELNSEKEKLYIKLSKLYNSLTKLRKESANAFSLAVIGELKELGMLNACFTVDFKDYEFEYGEKNANSGMDEIEFMFSANLGEPTKPLSKIISGGEMSRFMLSIKAVSAHLTEVGTFIFDEIDSGISGVIAQTVARKFAKISKTRQIIAISHLPQIASFADNSLLIYKTESENKTSTYVKNLSEDEKIQEIIRLVGGVENSKTAIPHAKEMLDYAKKIKKQV